MLNSLYEKAIAIRGSVKEYESNVDVDEIVDREWTDIPFAKSQEKFTIAAGDGSFNKKKFLTYNLCAVGAESLIYSDKLKKIEDSDIYRVNHIPFLDELLGNYMAVYEVKCAFRAITDYNIDYYMFDGSILGDLQNPVPRSVEQPKDLKENIDDLLIDNFYSRFEGSIYGLTCHNIRKNRFPNVDNNIEDYNLHLSSIEKLIILREILKNNKKLISISKTSSENKLCNSNIPDIAFFDLFTSNEGMSNIMHKKIKNTYFPCFGDFFKKLDFTVCYVRLEKNKNVFKLELPYYAEKSEIIQIIEKIKKLSVNGYPYLLNKSHNDVVITDRNMKELIKIAKIYEKTNREML